MNSKPIMFTQQDAIDYLSTRYLDYIPNFQDDTQYIQKNNLSMDIAISAIECRIPKRSEQIDELEYICPVCCESVEDIGMSTSFCSSCCQALLWNNEVVDFDDVDFDDDFEDDDFEWY